MGHGSESHPGRREGGGGGGRRRKERAVLAPQTKGMLKGVFGRKLDVMHA